MKAVLEGLLFVVGDDGLDLKEMSNLISLKEDEVEELITSVQLDYSSNERGIQIELLGNRYKLTTKKEHKQYFEKLVKEETNHELTQAALETLAIIAYNEPIARAEIDEIRGVSSSNVIRKLLLRDLVVCLGRADTPGRPMLYGTTSKFLDYFGLKNKDELPKIDVEEVVQEGVDLFNSKYKEENDI